MAKNIILWHISLIEVCGEKGGVMNLNFSLPGKNVEFKIRNIIVTGQVDG